MKNQAVPRQNQQGSAIIWILVLIALFGMLSYTLMQGSRSGAGQLTQEKARLTATEIISFLTTFKSTYNTLLISNGCSPDTVNFSTTDYMKVNSTTVDSAPPTTSDECSMYHAKGGNIRGVVFPDALNPSYVPTGTNWQAGNFGGRYINITNAGSNENDQAFYAIGFREEICLSVLKQVQGADITAIPVDNYSTADNNSYTQGPAGTLQSIQALRSGSIFVFKSNAGHNYCIIGVLLKAF